MNRPREVFGAARTAVVGVGAGLLVRAAAGVGVVLVVGLLIPDRGSSTVPAIRVRDGRRRSFAAACGLVAVGPLLGLLGFVRSGVPPGGGLATAVASPLLPGVLLASRDVERTGA